MIPVAGHAGKPAVDTVNRPYGITCLWLSGPLQRGTIQKDTVFPAFREKVHEEVFQGYASQRRYDDTDDNRY